MIFPYNNKRTRTGVTGRILVCTSSPAPVACAVVGGKPEDITTIFSKGKPKSFADNDSVNWGLIKVMAHVSEENAPANQHVDSQTAGLEHPINASPRTHDDKLETEPTKEFDNGRHKTAFSNAPSPAENVIRRKSNITDINVDNVSNSFSKTRHGNKWYSDSSATLYIHKRYGRTAELSHRYTGVDARNDGRRGSEKANQVNENLDKGATLKHKLQTSVVEKPDRRVEVTSTVEKPDRRVEVTSMVEKPDRRVEVTSTVEKPDRRVEVTSMVEKPDRRVEVTSMVEKPDRRVEVTSMVEKPDRRVEVTPKFAKKIRDFEDMSSCLQEHTNLIAFVNSIRIFHFQLHALNDPADYKIPRRCTINAYSVLEKRLQVVVRGETDGTVVRVYETMGGFTALKRDKTFKTIRNKMTVVVFVENILSDFNFTVSISAKIVKLEVIHLSATQGYIQSPGNDKWDVYWRKMYSTEYLYPPADHATLLSVSRFSVQCADSVMLTIKRKHQGKAWYWHLCGFRSPPPGLFDTPSIRVVFQSCAAHYSLGFRISYSFHPLPHLPTRVNDNLWNCSVPEWPEFQRHFLCDVTMDCHEGEDEAHCFYSGFCGHGYLTLDNRCYKYVIEKGISWVEASLNCESRGGHLVSLNVPSEWEAVLPVLTLRRNWRKTYAGVKPASAALPFMYVRSLQWSDHSVAFYGNFKATFGQFCGHFAFDQHELIIDTVVIEMKCKYIASEINEGFMCEVEPPSFQASGYKNQIEAAIRLATPPNTQLPVSHVECQEGHLTHDFLACDEPSACWLNGGTYNGNEAFGIPFRESCPAPLTSLPAMFNCRFVSQRVPYTMVCDHRQQCADGSDEDERLCVYRPCSGTTQTKCFTSFQCVDHTELCDNIHHCVDRSDESECYMHYVTLAFQPPPPPAVIHYKPTGGSNRVFRYDPITQLREEEKPATPCPHTHFQCPGGGYCLPVFMRCNEVVDCPGREDEAGCDVFTCPGFYRCRGSKVCLHVTFVCDGVPQCPERDDELNCHDLPCPHNCSCHGQAFTCAGHFRAGNYPELRYLNAKGSDLEVRYLKYNSMLVYLNIAHCGVRVLDDFIFPNLRTLDLSDNLMTTIYLKHLRGVTNLQIVILSGNPLLTIFPSELNETTTLTYLQSVDLSGVACNEINFSQFSAFPNLQNVNISHSKVRALYRSDNRSLNNLKVLDMRGCYVTDFQQDLMLSLSGLTTVVSENYKLCCSVVLPPMFNPKNCHAPLDNVSSCDNLMSSHLQRVLLAFCSCLALFGNAICIVFRFCLVRKNGSTATDVFVAYLVWGDLVMGACVAVVLVADSLYRGSYVLEDTPWRTSITCKAVGFLFLVSSQASVSVVFLVTLDRMLVLFSSSQGASFQSVSAHVACVIAWLVWSALASLPLQEHSEFFALTAVCMPLLIMPEHFPRTANGIYTLVFVTFSFLMTSFTATSQSVIHRTFHRNAANEYISSLHTSSPTSVKSQEVIHARRMFSPCVLNVVCWLSLFVLAALAWRGSPFPAELHVQVGVLALPVTSALRPLLYVLGVREEGRRRKRIQMLMRHIAAQRRQRQRKD